jgi:hypothetical protein
MRDLRGGLHRLGRGFGGLHGFEEDVFEGIALVVEAADLYVLLGGDLVELADFEAVGED